MKNSKSRNLDIIESTPKKRKEWDNFKYTWPSWGGARQKKRLDSILAALKRHTKKKKKLDSTSLGTRHPPIPLSPSAFFAPFSCPPISSYFLACLSSSVAIFRPRLLAISPFKNEKKAASYFFGLLLLGHQKNFSAFKKRPVKSKKVLLLPLRGEKKD